jgi:hypothetical protein
MAASRGRGPAGRRAWPWVTRASAAENTSPAASWSSTARSVSSWTRSALIAIAAADPAPAEVITWARGSTTLSAAQPPEALVRPVASTVTKPVALTSQPRPASRPPG